MWARGCEDRVKEALGMNPPRKSGSMYPPAGSASGVHRPGPKSQPHFVQRQVAKYKTAVGDVDSDIGTLVDREAFPFPILKVKKLGGVATFRG